MNPGKKLRSRRGETLTETLAAILIVALSSAVLAAMIGAASRMSSAVLRQDKALYDAVTAAETRPNSARADDPGTVTVTEKGSGREIASFSVTYYSDQDPDGTLYSYRYTK